MKKTRRDFLKQAAMASASAGFSDVLLSSIARAVEIDPKEGSSYLDAEHVVILMQENRSFDHSFGTLRGVRGFNDPRAIRLPNKNPVWLQTNAEGETYAPFRLNIKDTNATWMGSLPHSWTNQVDARNAGRYDRWLDTKRSGHKEYADMPLTMGFYTREDIPFYYALADAFTVCDQNFCSSLTGTTPNRLYLWTGTIREEQNRNSPANVLNEDADYDSQVRWTTFPERLEEQNISWKIYQNELSVGVEFEGEEDAWLANFGDNPIEYFAQYNVKFLPAYIQALPKKIARLTKEIPAMEEKLRSLAETDESAVRLKRQLERARAELKISIEDQKNYTAEKYEQLSPREKSIHQKAFTTNHRDPHYHQLTELRYRDNKTLRELKVPKGDVFHQFREDVKQGRLPTVSWLVAPENFSDHPGAAWYGAWYVSEAMNILTSNPEVWKKTIFILTYDENDGYFDHVPPFTPPHPDKPGAGLTSKSIDAAVEYVTLEQDLKRKPAREARESSIGLGYRVPLVIASPWSRGGQVCSRVFDHTSALQFLEKLLSHKTGRKIVEPNISSWRRTVCGDLTSVFRPYHGEKIPLPAYLSKDSALEGIHKAQFKRPPAGFRRLTQSEIDQINRAPGSTTLLPRQEKGTRPSCPLPYQLYADGNLSDDKKSFRIEFHAGNEIFGGDAAGSPFQVYAPGRYKSFDQPDSYQDVRTWDYAVAAGDRLTDQWPLNEFETQKYHLRVYGPNGFYREYVGSPNDPPVVVRCEYERAGEGRPTGKIELQIANPDRDNSYTVEIRDLAYKQAKQTKVIAPAGTARILLDLGRSSNWYDFSLKISGVEGFEKRYAGRVETGKPGISDPAMA
ncbi:MAG TPA: phospholipase C, phosphocholine-specific [Blastocatellia bacterium]|jgi:phospholipase C|nr:phospholipase C, phosphocholine-specific [Blastocatellia bacterium]